MLNHNFLTYGGKIIIQILGEILYFPIWWYTVGFGRLVKNIGHFLLNQEEILGFNVWLKNLFVPMYGQRDFVGRLISFVIRFIQIIFRGLALLVWLIIGLLVLLIWLFAPLAIFIACAFQIGQ